MAHEKLKAQYEEDAKNYDKPWELWQFRIGDKYKWIEFRSEPGWDSDFEYRRKDPITKAMKPKDKTDWSKVIPGTHVIINEEGKPAQKGIFLNSYVRASTKSGQFFNNIELSCTGILVWPCGSSETLVCADKEVSLDPDAPQFKEK